MLCGQSMVLCVNFPLSEPRGLVSVSWGVSVWFGHLVPFLTVVAGGSGFPGTPAQFKHFLETWQNLLPQA